MKQAIRLVLTLTYGYSVDLTPFTNHRWSASNSTTHTKHDCIYSNDSF